MDTPNPAPLDAACGLLRAAGASTVCAVLDMVGVAGTSCHLHPVAARRAFAGPAFTVQARVGALGSQPPGAFDIAAYADGAARGAVIAIDAGGAAVSVAGGIAALATQLRGVEAWVVDGGMRDLDELHELTMPIHLRHGTAVSGRTRVRIERTGVPVQIDGLAVQAGDVLVGDRSGIACVPQAMLARVVRMAGWITERDRLARALVLQGSGFADAFAAATARHTEAQGRLE
ncbi:MAG TPA: hypothetical protein VMS38_15950 [Pseudorhodoferax sp.]|jgi:regulator of RNase E activity RraA|nr:hypothetical protein [Pseudorhodoferax sp.]